MQGAVEVGGTHGKPHVPPLLRPVAIEQNESGKSLGALLASGEIDALIGSRKPDSFGRNPDVVRLLPNYRALERELYETKKIFPIMHLVAIKKSLYERHRWLASSFYKAFVESKARARARMRYGGSLSTMLPWLLDEIEEIDEVFGGRCLALWRRAQPPDARSAGPIHGRAALHPEADSSRRSVRADSGRGLG